MKPGKLLGLAAKIGASAALLWLALRGIDFAAAWRALGQVDMRLVLAGPLAIFSMEIVGGLRWHMLLRAHGVHLTPSRSVGLTLIGNFFNSGLPSTFGGDAARVFYAAKGGATLPAVAATTLLDRFAGVSCVTFATLYATTWGDLADVLGPIWHGIAVTLSVGILMGFVVLAAINYVPRPKSWSRPRANGTGWKAVLLDTLMAIAQLRVSVGTTALAVIVSVPVFVLVGLALAGISAASGDDFALGIARGIALAGPMMLVSSVPISFAGWGVREVFLVHVFPLLGLPAEVGLVTSLLYGLGTIAGTAPGLLVWLAIQRPAAETSKTG